MNLKYYCSLLAILCLSSISLSAQDKVTDWALKTGLGGAFFNNFSLEAERAIGGNKSVYLRGAIGNPIVRTDTAGFDRFYFKAGMRFYLGKDKADEGLASGFFIAPEAVFMYEFNSDFRLRSHSGKKTEHSLGGLIVLGYVLPLGSRIRIEATIGGGIIGTWLNHDYLDDVTFEVIPQPWYYLDHYDRKPYYNSHFSFAGSGAVSGSLSIGITL